MSITNGEILCVPQLAVKYVHWFYSAMIITDPKPHHNYLLTSQLLTNPYAWQDATLVENLSVHLDLCSTISMITAHDYTNHTGNSKKKSLLQLIFYGYFYIPPHIGEGENN